MENYSGTEIENSVWGDDYSICCDGYHEGPLRSLISTVQTVIDWSMPVILGIGLVLIPFLIYRKHKGEEGLWKKILKWDLIFFFIIAIMWFIIEIICWALASWSQINLI